jgi:hypothetical protein
MELANGIAIAGVWIGCGIYAHVKKEGDIFWVAFVMSLLM